MARVAAVSAVVAWVNTHPTLTGRGNPLDRGAHRSSVRSPGSGTYLLVARLDGAGALTAEDPVDEARMAGVVYSPSEDACEAAAVAYANALAALSGTHTPMGGAVCLVVDDIVGPQYIDNRAGASGELHAYQVDATFYLIPS